MPLTTSYARVPSELQSPAESGHECSKCSKASSPHVNRLFICLLGALFLNALALTWSAFAFYETSGLHGNTDAGLEYNFIDEIRLNSPFSDTDRTVQDAAWDSDDVRASQFAVALEDSFSEALGAPRSQRWPWDKSKGVYVLQCGHEMHCLHSLREAINDSHDGVKSRFDYGHLLHCVDLLRSGVMCRADDQLLYTGRLNDNAHRPGPEAPAGEGSERVCRDWNRLRAWAKGHSACYNGLRNESLSERDRYKNCPDGSRPWETV